MVLIRADANAQIGAGHMMRCLSVAHAFVEEGEKVSFVTADHKGDDLISGFDSICLNTYWRDMESELRQMEEVIERIKPSFVLVDSYYVTEKYLETLSSIVRTAYIDDLNSACWDVDYLINYNIYADTLDYSSYYGHSTELLLNTKYAPLRDEFSSLLNHDIRDSVFDVLVSAGGADPERVTERIITEVCPAYPDIHFHFIVGALNPRLETLRQQEGSNVILHSNERQIAKLMQQCDVAISAAGTTLYELCACGVPTITFILADNQIEAVKQMEQQKIMLSAGDCRGNAAFCRNVKDLLDVLSLQKRKELSECMQKLVDGKGAERIVKRMMTAITVVPCTETDFEDYYRIRCGESDIFWMGYDGPPARDQIELVFMSRLGRLRLAHPGDKRIYMIKANSRNVGFIQFSLSEEGVEFGYSVQDIECGKGYGSAGMKQAVNMAKTICPRCFCHIRDDNKASQKVMIRAGFKPTNDVEMKSFPRSGIIGYRKYELQF